MVTKTAVKVARRLNRLLMWVRYWVACVVGNGAEAERYWSWLTDDEAQLYPPEPGEPVADADAKRPALGLILLVLIVAGGTYVVCMLAGVV